MAREKYSELKLQAQFIKASPAYLTALGGSVKQGAFGSGAGIDVARMTGNVTNLFIIRQAVYNSLDSTDYRLTLPVSGKDVSVPQLSSTLTLNGRDSKIHVTDYDAGGTHVLYSTAEIFTWSEPCLAG